MTDVISLFQWGQYIYKYQLHMKSMAVERISKEMFGTEKADQFGEMDLSFLPQITDRLHHLSDSNPRVLSSRDCLFQQ